jgi:hypothetical protein
VSGSEHEAGRADLVIDRGGDPSPEELAALTVALTALGAAAAGPAADPLPPAWTRAALLEGVGARIVAAPGDLPGLPGVA